MRLCLLEEYNINDLIERYPGLARLSLNTPKVLDFMDTRQIKQTPARTQLENFFINGFEWMFENPEKTIAGAAGIIVAVSVYKLLKSN